MSGAKPAPWWRCLIDGCPVYGRPFTPGPGISSTRAFEIHYANVHTQPREVTP